MDRRELVVPEWDDMKLYFGKVTASDWDGVESRKPKTDMDRHLLLLILMARLDDGTPARGSSWPAVTNVGSRPTFESEGRVLAEAHLIDFEGDLYGRRIEVFFLHHLRPEQRFSGIEALREQIQADVLEARRRLEAP